MFASLHGRTGSSLSDSQRPMKVGTEPLRCGFSCRRGSADTWMGICYFAGGHLLAKPSLPCHLPLISAFQSLDSLTPTARIAGNIQSCILSRQG